MAGHGDVKVKEGGKGSERQETRGVEEGGEGRGGGKATDYENAVKPMGEGHVERKRVPLPGAPFYEETKESARRRSYNDAGRERRGR